MVMHRRTFHLHVTQRPETTALTWAVSRSYWSTGQPTRSAVLGSGMVDASSSAGDTLGVAAALLEAALADYLDELRNSRSDGEQSAEHAPPTR